MTKSVIYLCDSCHKKDEFMAFQKCADCGRETCGWCGVIVGKKNRCNVCAAKYLDKRDKAQTGREG